MSAPPAGWPLAAPLDDYLREMVTNLRQLTDQGLRKVHDQPAEAERSLRACQEILDVILSGDVHAWLSA
jgi:hypothetical protein